MNRANFFKSSLGVFLFRKPPAVETKPERDHYIGKIRGGQIWKQDDFPCFSVMLVPGCAEHMAGGPSWIMANDPRHQQGNTAIHWEHPASPESYSPFWTTRELEEYLIECGFTLKGDCSKLILEHWYEAYCETPPVGR